jgi:hypothetical protein
MVNVKYKRIHDELNQVLELYPICSMITIMPNYNGIQIFILKVWILLFLMQ